jgi:hypothetical protein
MVECENVMFIEFDTTEKKEYFSQVFTESIKFFESFIPYFSTKLETYGTGSDVYIEYIEVEEITGSLLKLTFHTHETPCIEFCRRFAWVHTLNVQLYYYNEEHDFAGRFSMFKNQNTLDQRTTFLNGMYRFEPDRFWNIIVDHLDTTIPFHEFMENHGITITGPDYEYLEARYNEVALINQFKGL